MKKVRLDQLITELGLAPSRERAKAVIMAGEVFVDGQRVDKPGTPVDPEKLCLTRRIEAGKGTEGLFR